MNGFKISPKDEEDETCNTYLVKSLPLIKKTTFSINGKSHTFTDLNRLLWAFGDNQLKPRFWQTNREVNLTIATQRNFEAF